MTRAIKPKPPAGPTLDQRVSAALQLLSDNPGKSIRSAALENNVGESTLRARLKGGRSRTEEMTSRRRLSKAETRELADHAKRMQDHHFPLTPAVIRLEAQRIYYTKYPDAEDAETAIGVNWYRNVFLKDNPDMANKLGKGLDRNRATCASHSQLAAWYENVSCTYIFNRRRI